VASTIFRVAKKYTHAATEEIKCKAQQLATENEVVATLSERTNIIQQTLLEQDIPLHRV
jgi:hypothetical protein